MRGKPIPDAIVRVETDDGRIMEVLSDSRGAYRIEANGRFRLEVRHEGYRTVRSSDALIPNGGADYIYQADVSLLPGDPNDIETVELRLEEVADVQNREEASVREAVPQSDRQFGLRGGVNVTGIREGSGQQRCAACGSAFTSWSRL